MFNSGIKLRMDKSHGVRFCDKWCNDKLLELVFPIYLYSLHSQCIGNQGVGAKGAEVVETLGSQDRFAIGS